MILKLLFITMLLISGSALAADAPAVEVVVYGARRCPACNRMADVVAELALTVKVRHVDFDADRDARIAAGVTLMPTFIVYRGGREVARHTGIHSIETVRGWLTEGSEVADKK